MRALLALLLACAALACPDGTAAAQAAEHSADEQRRKVHFGEGSSAALEGRWADALSHFREARAIRETSGAVFNLAVAQMELGMNEAAFETFHYYLAMPTAMDKTEKRAHAERSIEILSARLPAPQNPPQDAQPIPSIDEAAEPPQVPVATPEPQVVAEAPPAPRPLAEPEPQTRWNGPTQPAQATEAQRSAMPWVLIGSGGALLVGALVTGSMASSALDELKQKCDGKLCEPELVRVRDRADTLAAITDVLWITGALATSVGVTLWALDGDEPRDMRARLRVAPGGLSFRGTF